MLIIMKIHHQINIFKNILRITMKKAIKFINLTMNILLKAIKRRMKSNKNKLKQTLINKKRKRMMMNLMILKKHHLLNNSKKQLLKNRKFNKKNNKILKKKKEKLSIIGNGDKVMNNKKKKSLKISLKLQRTIIILLAGHFNSKN